MDRPQEIAKADRISRMRPTLFAFAGVYFGLLQLVLHPYFSQLSDPAMQWRRYAWILNAVAILMILAFGGGYFNRTSLSRLVNDELSRQNSLKAVSGGFWIAMATAIGIYIVPIAANLTARQAIYVIVSAATTFALVAFAWFEHRANRDA